MKYTEPLEVWAFKNIPNLLADIKTHIYEMSVTKMSFNDQDELLRLILASLRQHLETPASNESEAKE